jgi:hypothetical protein
VRKEEARSESGKSSDLGCLADRETFSETRILRMRSKVGAPFGDGDEAAAGVSGAFRFHAIEKIEEQGVRLNALAGFVREDKEGAGVVELVGDGVDGGGVGAVEKEDRRQRGSAEAPETACMARLESPMATKTTSWKPWRWVSATVSATWAV